PQRPPTRPLDAPRPRRQRARQARRSRRSRATHLQRRRPTRVLLLHLPAQGALESAAAEVVAGAATAKAAARALEADDEQRHHHDREPLSARRTPRSWRYVNRPAGVRPAPRALRPDQGAGGIPRRGPSFRVALQAIG